MAAVTDYSRANLSSIIAGGGLMISKIIHCHDPRLATISDLDIQTNPASSLLSTLS